MLPKLIIFRHIWSPILEFLFSPGKNVRVKAGESINIYTTECKQQLYHESNYVKGFKIDFRLLIDLYENEFDLGVGECAKTDADIKAIEDEGKLIREGKDALDVILKLVKDDDAAIQIWIIQLLVLHVFYLRSISSTIVYVTKHRHSFNISSTVQELKSISESLSYLLTMRRDVNKLADTIISGYDNKPNVEGSFNRKSTKRYNKRLAYTRDSYYTPPRSTTSKLPITTMLLLLNLYLELWLICLMKMMNMTTTICLGIGYLKMANTIIALLKK